MGAGGKSGSFRRTCGLRALSNGMVNPTLFPWRPAVVHRRTPIAVFSACVRGRLGTCNAVHRSCGAVTLCADVACLAWAGWIGDQRGLPFRPERTPRSLLETRPAKEAKETDGLWWKTPRLFDRRDRKGIAVRTKWQSGRAERRRRAAAPKGEPPPPATGGAPRGNPTRT